MNAQHSSKTGRWFTPCHIVNRARAALGGDIDLDPASEPSANRWVRARQYYTKDEDGLMYDWRGKVFLNPPGGKTGGKSNAGLWWAKLTHEIAAGRVKAAIFMAFSLESLAVSQNYGAAYDMLDCSFCVPRKRIAFVSPTGHYNSPSHSNVIVLAAGNPHTFKSAFEDLGAVSL